MSAHQTGIGIVGCGNIFEAYLRGLRRFPQLHIAGIADVDPQRAADAARKWNVTAFATVDELLASKDVEVIVNITTPRAHAPVSLAALEAGKDVYVEKPLAASLEEAREVLDRARELGRRVGCAPDTFLGSAVQTVRSAIDAGVIGEPIGAAGFISSTRAEQWHPDPTFLFTAGGGPLLDMGPYWIAALVNILGPVVEVSGATRIGATPRVVDHAERLVESIDVEVATHASATLRFGNGAIGTLLMSFDVWHEELPHIEIYGTTGALRLPSPNDFDGAVLRRGNFDTGWTELESLLPESGERGNEDEQMQRGIGVADLVRSRAGGPHRASGEFAYHALDVLASIQVASDQRTVVVPESTCVRPEALSLAADAELMPWAAATQRA